MMLCSNRPEGFGPHSNIHPDLPTTCFLDVVVVPLPTWLFLLTTPVLILAFLRHRKNRAFTAPKSDPPSRLSRIATIIYYTLIVAMLAMVSLELARLELAQLGIGLLPFTYVGILLAGASHFFIKASFARYFSALFWILLAAAMALKLAALDKEEGPHNRVGITHKYPLGDEVTDNGVMIGVEVVLAILEVVTA